MITSMYPEIYQFPEDGIWRLRDTRGDLWDLILTDDPDVPLLVKLVCRNTFMLEDAE